MTNFFICVKVKNMKKFVDLHIHSLYSDGVYSPQDVFFFAEKNHSKLISITDHNCIDFYKHLRNVNSYGIEVISGCEFSAFDNENSYHIIGYGMDLKNKELNTYLDNLKHIRHKRFLNYLKHLHSAGVELPIEKLKKHIQNGYGENKQAIKFILMENNIPFDNQILANAKKENGIKFPMEKKSPRWISNLIKQAGGIPILAHPYRYLKYQTDQQIIPHITEFSLQLKDFGVDGIECYHSNCPMSFSEYLLSVAKQNNFLITGGSDSHFDSINNIKAERQIAFGKDFNLCLTENDISQKIINLKRIILKQNELSK